MSVNTTQRYSAQSPCPVCDGHQTSPRGQGQRCYGFRSEDKNWAHWTRPSSLVPWSKTLTPKPMATCSPATANAVRPIHMHRPAKPLIVLTAPFGAVDLAHAADPEQADDAVAVGDHVAGQEAGLAVRL